MRIYLFVLSAVLFFSGCSVKVYEPKKVEVKKLKIGHKNNKYLRDYANKGLTFTKLKL